MVVVAHPDDENMMGSMLARFAREGHRVHVVIATDGKDGTRVTKIPAGDELGAIRRKESQCACQRLGIPPPLFLGIDRLDTKNGVRSYLNGRKALLQALQEQLQTIRPDALFTFGPDGEYGHSEHIVIGAALTELLLREGLVEAYPLYYFAWTREDVGDDEDLSYVDRRYLDAEVPYREEDKQRELDAARCYVTQYTAEEMAENAQLAASQSRSTVFLRRLRVH